MSPGAGEPCDIFVHDPEVPVIAPGGPAAASGPFDQAALEMGNNLLVYSTEPLEKPLWIFGIPRVVLYCATSRVSADFTAKLVRVKQNGAAEFICFGVARSSRLFAEGQLRRGQSSPLGFFPRTYLVPVCHGRPHPPGNRQQRISAHRPQSRERRAVLPGDFVGLAAIDAIRFPRARLPVRFVSARVRGAGMNAGGRFLESKSRASPSGTGTLTLCLNRSTWS